MSDNDNNPGENSLVNELVEMIITLHEWLQEFDEKPMKLRAYFPPTGYERGLEYVERTWEQ